VEACRVDGERELLPDPSLCRLADLGGEQSASIVGEPSTSVLAGPPDKMIALGASSRTRSNGNVQG